VIINFSPQRRNDTLTLYKQGDILTINNIPYDFSPIPEGGTLPREAIDCKWICRDVERIDGEIHISLILPHGPNPTHDVAFPEPIRITADGEVVLPK
jgi:hypothetical protein